MLEKCRQCIRCYGVLHFQSLGADFFPHTLELLADELASSLLWTCCSFGANQQRTFPAAQSTRKEPSAFQQ